jgi:hypothetical protein
MALGGFGQHVSAQEQQIGMGQMAMGYMGHQLHGQSVPMFPNYASIETNNSDERRVEPPREIESTMIGWDDVSRATASSFTHVPPDSELVLELVPYSQPPSNMQFFPRGASGMDEPVQPLFSEDMYQFEDERVALTEDERGDLFPIRSVGPPYSRLADPFLEVGYADSNLVRYYMEFVQPMQYFFADRRVLDQIKELVISGGHPLLRDAICAVASVHQRRKRNAPFFNSSQDVLSANMLPIAGTGEDDDGYRKKAQHALTRLAYSQSASAQNLQGQGKVTRLKDVDALAGLECVSIFLFDGGLGDWNVFLSFACDWVESRLAKASETAQQSGKELWEVMAEGVQESALSMFVVRTTMWFEVLASVTQIRQPRFFDYYRVIFGPLDPSRFEDISDPSFLRLDANQSQKSRQAERDRRFSMLEVMGCDNSTFLAIAEISALSAWKEENAQMGCLSAVELVRRGTDIETRYLSRAPPIFPGTGPNSNVDDLETRRHYTSAIFFAAAKLYLHTVLSGDRPSVPEIAGGVRETVEALEKVPVQPSKLRSSVVRSVVFPICLAGCMTEDIDDGTVLSPSSAATLVSRPTSSLGKRSRSSTQSSFTSGDYRKTLLKILHGEALDAGNCGEVVKVMEEVWELRRKAKAEAKAELERQQAKRMRVNDRGVGFDDRNLSISGGEVNWREVLRKREAALLLV